MRLVGLNSSFNLRGFRLGALCLLIAGLSSPLLAQTAPYVLPYTMSTFAGPHAGYNVGDKCSNMNVTPNVTDPSLLALDALGSGCLASQVEVGGDPHDVRVDALGNVYWVDNESSYGTVYKVLALTGLKTAYVGGVAKGKPCTAGDKYGDGCTATDGAANTGALGNTTTIIPKSRGLAISSYGDLFLAEYNGHFDAKVSAATGFMSIIAGTGTANTSTPPTEYAPPSPTNPTGIASAVNGTRGIGVDSRNGLVYVADTGDNVLRLLTPAGTACTGQPVSSCYASATITMPQATVTANAVVSGVPLSQELLDAPEDVQVDTKGNIVFTQQANNVVMAVYGGSGPFFGILNPVQGYVYLIAGNPVPLSSTAGTLNTTYPSDGSNPVVLATTVNISTRKIGLDALGNVYIADSGNNVVWFVDHLTGYMHLLAGRWAPVPSGTTAPTPTPYGCPAATAAGSTIGDGCPGPLASLFDASNMGNAPDNQGNLFITDNEGNANASRIRELLSGLNFPATTSSAPITQTIFVHFAGGDSPAAINGFNISGSDFTAGTPSCKVNAAADNTADCLVPITFKPTVSGYDTATLTITSTLGATNTYLVTGTGNYAAIAIDPGSDSVLPATTNAATGVAYDAAGNVYIADTGNNRVLKYNVTTSTTTTFAGTGTANFSGDGTLATTATLNGPTAVAIATDGSVYIADTGNNAIRKVNAAGIISTYAGRGAGTCATAFNSRGDGCIGTSATFSSPSGLAADSKGVLYVADTGNNVVRTINNLGFVATLAGGATASTTCSAQTDTFGDGCAATQSIFNGPTGLAFDAAGHNLFIADTGDNIVRKVLLSNKISFSSAGVVTAESTNPVTLVAGNGSAGSSIDVNSVAALSQLNHPIGVAVDPAGNTYIADSGNHAIRLVSQATGTISTIAGINAASGNTAITGAAPATAVQMNTPSGVAASPNGTLYIADTANNRVLVDTRSQVTYNFGRINLGASSPVINFTELSIGNTTATLSTNPSTPLLTPSGATTQFTLTAPTSSAACSAGASLAPGAACILQGQFTPTAQGTVSATYTEATATSAAGAPAIVLTGTGAVLTPTTGTVAQTNPATGNAQFGGSVTLSVTVAAACNNAAPSCFPTGTVQLIIDTVSQSPLTLSSTGTASQAFTGLSVGPHTISCSYSGDNFYAASTCAPVTITVAPASTTALLSATNNNVQQYPTTACSVITAAGPTKNDIQCVSTILTATVISNTTGVPTGTVNFFATGNGLSPSPYPLGSAPVNSTTGVANLPLTYIVDTNGDLVSDGTLAPGTYQLSCSYSGASNFASSNCAPISFTVVPQPVGFTLSAQGCVYNDMYIAGTNTAGQGITCQPVAQVFQNGAPLVATADGSTTDVTIFINPSNTFSGTLTFSCSGLPTYGACTFSPTSVTLTAGKTYASPVYTDMTLWTDIQPPATAANHGPSIGNGQSGVQLAMIVGWPITLLGFTGLIAFRRRKPGALRGLTLTAILFIMAGSSLIFTGCGAGGPGAYKPVLTPAGTYPITVKVTGNGVTQTTLVYFKVASPGIIGQQ
ncbi:MAG: Ig-like domain repeat protein [Acidobacteriota bacterium]